MTLVLVSVRNAEEAVVAAVAGAPIVDVKEPARGSLGSAGPAVWRAVRAACSTLPGARPGLPGAELSAALGELDESPDPESLVALQGYSFAKVGLAGCRSRSGWQRRWRKWAAGLPPEVAPVAVCYADYQQADAPAPREILAAACGTRTRVLLVDTWCKANGDLFAYSSPSELSTLIEAAHGSGLRVALAGSLTLSTAREAALLGPDVIAVRGAVCRAGRIGPLDGALVKRLLSVVSTPEALITGAQNRETIDAPISGP